MIWAFALLPTCFTTFDSRSGRYLAGIWTSDPRACPSSRIWEGELRTTGKRWMVWDLYTVQAAT